MNVRHARAEAEKLVRRFGYDTSDLPIDVRGVAKKLGLTVKDAVLDDDVSGLLVSKQGDDTTHIFVNGNDRPVRKRFTIAHEIGHFVLGHEFEASGVHVDRGMHVIPRRAKLSKAEPKEVEANQFAAALLMPSDLVHEAVDALGLPLLTTTSLRLQKPFR
ncbi:MAG: ImmA/IrrE family metallo-endopeptidase [Acidobacteria bacterium]|nr:ImmA/IrrE family metallo-endopeptidase [Acidobacteriota bacterium]